MADSERQSITRTLRTENDPVKRARLTARLEELANKPSVFPGERRPRFYCEPGSKSKRR